MRTRHQPPIEDFAAYVHEKLRLLTGCNLMWPSPGARRSVIDGLQDPVHAVSWRCNPRSRVPMLSSAWLRACNRVLAAGVTKRRRYLRFGNTSLGNASIGQFRQHKRSVSRHSHGVVFRAAVPVTSRVQYQVSSLLFAARACRRHRLCYGSCRHWRSTHRSTPTPCSKRFAECRPPSLHCPRGGVMRREILDLTIRAS